MIISLNQMKNNDKSGSKERGIKATFSINFSCGN